MTYFELINKILLELNYQEVAVFNDLTKSEHKRIKDIINRLNNEICNLNNNFYFRQATKFLQLVKDKVEYKPNISGKIISVRDENVEYDFEPDFTKFYGKNYPQYAYSTYGNKFLFPPVNRKIKIFYTSNMFVKDEFDDFKSAFDSADDTTIIPDNFVEKLFINGVAFNFKQNVSHPKYNHWQAEYNKAVADLLANAKQCCASDTIIDGGFRKL